MQDVTVSLQLIQILADGSIYSGKQLSILLYITRDGINAHIHTLHKWGVEVNVIAGKSYQLTRKIDLLDYERIYGLVRSGSIFVKLAINSTNQYLLECIDQLSSGDACIAEYQTSGRGRRGRYWTSSFGGNLCLSLYWNLKKKSTSVIGISLVVGIVIAETLNKLIGSNIKIKWPNDLYCHNKKLAGILIEIVGQAGNKAHIVIGIGINITMSRDYAKNIKQGWINLEQAGFQIERNVLAAQIILALRYALMQFEEYSLAPFIKRWWPLDHYLHQAVILHIDNHLEVGIAKGINAHGAILLEQHGKIVSYMGNEISLRIGPCNH